MNTTTAPAFIAKCANGHTAKTDSFQALQSGVYIVCPCGSRGIARSMNITIVPERACTSRCTNAQGPTCDCSCGGHNHGADHTA